MTEKEIQETLEKQLQLLSERSSSPNLDSTELAGFSKSMYLIAKLLMDPDWDAISSAAPPAVSSLRTRGW